MSAETATSQHEEEGEDSLFGSPPPSPRGRSPSPALALPSSSHDAQNVGTIALPGSHLYSELPVNPLASSSSLLQAPRPPAQGVNPPPAHQSWPTQSRLARSASASSGPSRSRTSSAAPTPKPKKKSKAKSKESTPRPPGPEITLPDPSAPLPAHFLRNQSALLGTAGLVGGVKPSNLTTNRQTRGTTSSNPIVVEDETDTPAIGKSHFRHPYMRPIDPSLLPAPTNQEIVSVLIRQKDIFPVLESVLKLIASGSVMQPQQTGFERRAPAQRQQEQDTARASSSASSSTSAPSTSSGPPPKKRKLNRVPAGAADWDVPYPFANGEGPESYRTTWERERGKQLISQLVNLVKTAAHKAATKSYMQNEENRRRVIEEQRRLREESQRRGDMGKENTSENGSGGSPAVPSNSGLSSASPAPTSYYRQQQLEPQQPQQQLQPSTPFDQLISSLLAASPEQRLPAAPVAGINPSVTLYNGAPTQPSLTTQPISPDANGNVDQALFDSWMNVLQTFPVPTEGFVQPSDAGTSSASTPAAEDFSVFDAGGFDFDNMDMDFGAAPAVGEFEALISSLGQGQSLPDGNAMNVDSSAAVPPAPANLLPPQNSTDINHLIDPALLAISIPQPAHPSGMSTNGDNTQPPSLAPSPIPSMSSFAGQNDPATPNSAIWDMSLPDIFTGADVGEQGILERQGTLWSNFMGAHDAHYVAGNGADGDEAEAAAILGMGRRQDKGKGREVEGQSYAGMVHQQRSGASVPPSPTSAKAPTSAAALVQLVKPKHRKKGSSRQEILSKAREKRKQLAEELDRVKMLLWEATIEQGALTHLVKHFNEAESINV